MDTILIAGRCRSTLKITLNCVSPNSINHVRKTIAFIQIIEFVRSRIDEANQLFDQWLAQSQGKRTARSIVLTSDQDRPNTYDEIVEFPSYEDAMQNSELAETQAISAQMVALCESGPTFRNLDVVREERL